MNRYDFLCARRVILSDVRSLTKFHFLVNMPCKLEQIMIDLTYSFDDFMAFPCVDGKCANILSDGYTGFSYGDISWQHFKPGNMFLI